MPQIREFIIDVGDLVDRPGSQRRTVVSGQADFGVELSRLAEGRPLHAELLLESLVDGILVSGDVAYVGRHSCNRCLRQWDEEGSVRVVQLYGHQPDEDGFGIEGGHLIDVEQLLRDEVVLGFPLTPLCRSDCKGLCPICGADLNESLCSGHPEESGSPFAALRELFESQE